MSLKGGALLQKRIKAEKCSMKFDSFNIFNINLQNLRTFAKNLPLISGNMLLTKFREIIGTKFREINFLISHKISYFAN
jgi:hypothetical protein